MFKKIKNLTHPYMAASGPTVAAEGSRDGFRWLRDGREVTRRRLGGRQKLPEDQPTVLRVYYGPYPPLVTTCPVYNGPVQSLEALSRFCNNAAWNAFLFWRAIHLQFG